MLDSLVALVQLTHVDLVLLVELDLLLLEATDLSLQSTWYFISESLGSPLAGGLDVHDADFELAHLVGEVE